MSKTTGSNIAGQIIRLLDRFEGAVATLAFIVLVAAIFADVLARELTGAGLHWARQLGVYANIIIVMAGLGMASSRAAHLRPRFADRLLPARWDGFIDTAREYVMAAFCLLFAALALRVTLDAWLLAERSLLIGILIWPLLAVMPLAFVLTAIRHVIYALQAALRPPDPLSSSIVGRDRRP